MGAEIHSATEAMLTACIEAYKKLNGFAPYNVPSNICWGDGYFAKSIRAKFPLDIQQRAQFELGLIKEIPKVAEAVEAPANPQLTNAEISVGGGEETDELLKSWEHAKAEAKKWKEEEMRLRKAVSATYFPDPKEGSNKLTDNVRGVTVKAEYTMNRSVSKAKVEAVQEALTLHMGDEPLPIWFRNGKPELNLRVYKGLNKDIKDIIDNALSSKMGSPTVTLEKIAEKV